MSPVVAAAVTALDFASLGAPEGAARLAPPLVFAHFLPWFTRDPERFALAAGHPAMPARPARLDADRHWRDPGSGYVASHLHWPLPGRYDSRDPEIVRWQIRQARAAGIVGFSINWYGQNSAENVITLAVLAEIERWNRAHEDEHFLYFLCIDAQAALPTEGKTPVSLVEDLVYIRRHLLRPGYLLRGGRPVFACFPYADDAPRWIVALAEVFGPDGADFLWSGPGAGVGETGCYAWVRPSSRTVRPGGLYPWTDPDDSGADHARTLYSAWNGPGLGHRYGMAGVWPGFDDQLVTWAWQNPAAQDRTRPRVINRETSLGNTYRLTWAAYHEYLAAHAAGDAAARLPIPLVQIATWNDYAEATTIEPTRDHGARYCEMTAEGVARARALWPPTPAGVLGRVG